MCRTNGARPNFTLNYGVRYDYYTPMGEANDLQVKFNVDTGVIDPPTTPSFKSTKTNFQPRVGADLLPDDEAPSFAEASACSSDPVRPKIRFRRLPTRTASVPRSPPALRSLFRSIPPSLSRTSSTTRTIVHSSRARTRTNTRSLSGSISTRRRFSRISGHSSPRRPPTSARRDATCSSAASRIRSRGRHQSQSGERGICHPRVFHPAARSPRARSRACRIRTPKSTIKTSGGRDNYNALQLGLTRRSASGCRLNAQYTLSRSFGNTSGSNEALTAANNARALDRVRLRPRLQRLRRASYVQLQRALLDPVRQGPKIPERRSPACVRRLGRRRHRQRPQRPADRRARDASGRPVRGRRRELLQQSRRGPNRRHQHAGRRQLTQRPPSGSRSRRGPVHQRAAGCCS